MECPSPGHEHCSTCVQASCKDASCPPSPCPNACGSTLHPCKLEDHQLVCLSAVVPCLNAVYGCTAEMQRSKLGSHLARCPASVLVCKYSWERCAVENGVASRKDMPPLYDEELLRADTQLMHSSIESDSNVQLGIEIHPGLIGKVKYVGWGSAQRKVTKCFVASHESWFSSGYSQRKYVKYIFSCPCVVRRDEASEHFQWHQVQGSLYGPWAVHRCPNHIYGCSFALERIVPRNAGSRVVFSSSSHCFTVKTPSQVQATPPGALEGHFLASIRKKQELSLYGYSMGEPLDPLSQLPALIILQVLGHLDSYTLHGLAQVSHYFKDLCSELVGTRGVVELCWRREERPGMYRKWQEGADKAWSFTRSPSLPQWSYSQERGMLCAHMEQCPVLRKSRAQFEDLSLGTPAVLQALADVTRAGFSEKKGPFGRSR